jgi:histidine triad (HIT) family protein
MSLDGTYDPANIFAKIIRGEAPAAKVMEDDHALVFMDVFPQSRGHMMVISKQSHARNILDCEPEVLERLILVVQRIVRAARVALKPDGIMVSQFNGAPAGQSVFHLHFHVIPRFDGVPLGRHAGGGMADPKELAELAKSIAAAID